MKSVSCLALIDPVDSTRNTLRHVLRGVEAVCLEVECSRYEFFFDVAMQTHPNLALIALDSDPAKALALVGRISQDLPHLQVARGQHFV